MVRVSAIGTGQTHIFAQNGTVFGMGNGYESLGLFEGRLVAEGTQQELITMISDSCTVKITTVLNETVTADSLIKSVSSLPDVNKARFADNVLSVDMNISCTDISHVISELVRLGMPVLEVNTEKPDMDAVFLSLTGHDIR